MPGPPVSELLKLLKHDTVLTPEKRREVYRLWNRMGLNWYAPGEILFPEIPKLVECSNYLNEAGPDPRTKVVKDSEKVH